MKQVNPTFILNTNDGSEHPFLISMEDNKQDISEPSEQSGALEKVQQDTEIIDFSKGILTYVDVDFSEYRKRLIQRLSEEMWLYRVG